MGKNLSVFLTAKGQVLTCGIQDLTALSETECKLNRPCPVQGLDDIVDVSVGAEHVLVLNKKGQVYGWGNNFNSQLGLDPDVHGDLVAKPILIPGNKLFCRFHDKNDLNRLNFQQGYDPKFKPEMFR